MNLVSKVRVIVEKSISQEQIEKQDIDNFRELDSYVTRFLEDKDFNVEKAAKVIVESLRWRTVHKASDIRASDIPRELVDCGQTWSGLDNDGGHYFLSKLGNHKRFLGVSDLIITHSTFYIDGLLRTHGQDYRCDVYYDMRGSGYKTVDLELTHKMTELMDVNYSGFFKKVYIYGLNPFIKRGLDMIMKMLPKRCTDRVVFLTVEEAEARMVTRTPTLDNEELSTLEEIGQRKGWTSETIVALQEYYRNMAQKCEAANRKE